MAQRDRPSHPQTPAVGVHLHLSQCASLLPFDLLVSLFDFSLGFVLSKNIK